DRSNVALRDVASGDRADRHAPLDRRPADAPGRPSPCARLGARSKHRKPLRLLRLTAVTASGPTTIPSRGPRREELRGRRVQALLEGGGAKADVLAVDLPSGPVIVKDFSRRSFWGRLAGRLQIARETKAYRRLEGVAGVPRFVGRIDPWALALERLDARQLAFEQVAPAHGERYVPKLPVILDALHARD